MSVRIYKRIPWKPVAVVQSTTDTLDAATITTTETVFTGTYTIPANTLVTNKLFRVTYCLQVTTSASAATQRFRVRLGGIGGTIVYDSTAIAPANNLSTRAIMSQFFIQGTAAAGASVNVLTGGPMTTASPTTGIIVANTVNQPVAIATNAAQAITLTLQYGAGTAGNTVTLTQLLVEEIN